MICSSAYYLEVIVHQILELYPFEFYFVNISFPAKSSYRLHFIKLKLDFKFSSAQGQRGPPPITNEQKHLNYTFCNSTGPREIIVSVNAKDFNTWNQI